MSSLWIAYDIICEAFARRYMLLLLVFAGLASLLLLFGLNLEVVDGALAATKFFGKQFGNTIVPLDVALRPVFAFLAQFIFHVSILVGIIALPDLVLRVMKRERVLASLALPIRRSDLILGAFFGGLCFYCLILLILYLCIALIFHIKADLPMLALVGPTIWSGLGFVPLLAILLAVSVRAESVAISLGVGTLIHATTLLTSNRNIFANFFHPGIGRQILRIIISPLPRTNFFAELAVASINGDKIPWGEATPAIAGCLLFSASFVGLAAFLFERKDY
jgi:Cu-processing system permease protein